MDKAEMLIKLNQVLQETTIIISDIIENMESEGGNQFYFSELDNEKRYKLKRSSKECYKIFLKVYENI